MGGESWYTTKDLKPQSQISRLGMWIICVFAVYTCIISMTKNFYGDFTEDL